MLKRIAAALAAGCAYLGSVGTAAADPISIGSFVISAFLSTGMGALLPAVSAALIGNVVLGAAIVGLSIAQSAMMKKPTIHPQEFRSVFKGQNDASELRAIGRVRIGGMVAFGNTNGLNRYRLICHTKGLWTATEEHLLGGREVTVEDNGDVSSPPYARQSGTYVTVNSKLGDGSETAWPALVSEFSELWTSAHRVRGIHQSLVKYISPGMNSETAIKRHQLLYQSGEPPYEKVGRAEPIYDPRVGGQSSTNAATWAWSDNAILGAAHILRTFPSIAATDLDYTAIATAATAADASVATLDGTEVRARAWGIWTSESSRGDIMEQVLSSIGGEIVPTDDNKYAIRLVDDDPAAEITFYEQHVVDIDYASGPESVQRPNVCRIKYYCPERNYDFADIDLTGIAWARVQDEIDRVGEQIEQIELPFCPSASQAQRIGRLLFALKRADAGIMKLNYAGVAAWGLTVASLPFPNVGADGATVWKKCAIGSPRINDGDGTVDLPFVVWPELEAWNPATMEAPAPDPIPDLQYPSDLDTPAAPAEYAQVIYPGGARELRIRFAGVTGGTIAEATRRNYSGANPNPWASMTEYLGHGGSNWYAYAGVDWEGDDADFRVRFFNSAEEGSYWSPLLSPRPVAAPNNSATGAPTIISAVATDVNDGVVLTFKAGELRAVRAVVQYDWESSGWTTHSTINPLRPDTLHTVTMDGFNNMSPFNQNLNWRVATLTSNGTVGTYATGTVVIPGTGGP